MGSAIRQSDGEAVRVHRPFQYLGAKLRSIETITKVADQYGAGPHVLDLFAGTSVVSQAFAATGRRVTASDALLFPSVVASATLGVARSGMEEGPDCWLSGLGDAAKSFAWRDAWGQWLNEEGDALEREDAHSVRDVYARLPLAWRNAAGGDLERVLVDVRGQEGRIASFPLPIMTAYFAGTYFGVRQALDLDSIRQAIDVVAPDNPATTWTRSVMLAALVGVASRIVLSAGKHFAQPLRIGAEMPSRHVMMRLLVDRAYDVWTLFREQLEELVKIARPPGEHHRSYRRSMEEWLAATKPLASVSAIYADPPYTAQQYSRFYHVPELLVSGRVPRLQKVRGEVTSGIYPEGRHFSRFCRKSQAVAAFQDLFGLSRNLNAVLLLSYSDTGADNGNARMLNLESLIRLAHDCIPEHRIDVVSLGHAYRQFNSREVAVKGRSDVEHLLVARPAC